MFLFLKYTRPSWYYRLYNKSDVQLYSEETIKYVKDNSLINIFSYKDEISVYYDIVYQLINNAYIDNSSNKKTIDTYNKNVTSVKDNYIFIRRFFSTKWLIYILIIRILSLKNIYLEFKYFLKCLSINKVEKNYYFDDIELKKLDKRSSRSYFNDFITIIIPTLNRYAYLSDALVDLENQTYKNFEVIICDQSDNFDPSFYRRWKIDIKYIYQSKKALWAARNKCIELSKGRYIILFDDDSRVNNDWIQSHIDCITKYKNSISAGITRTVKGNQLAIIDSRYHYSDVFDTGNSMLDKNIFKKIGLFDERFEKQRMGDGEFGLRAYLNGYSIISNPLACRDHLKVKSGGLREFGSWDAFSSMNILSPKPIPSAIYFITKYFDKNSTIFFIINSLIYNKNHKIKSKYINKIISILIDIIFFPITLLRIIASFHIAEKMLNQGSIIRKYNEYNHIN